MRYRNQQACVYQLLRNKFHNILFFFFYYFLRIKRSAPDIISWLMCWRGKNNAISQLTSLGETIKAALWLSGHTRAVELIRLDLICCKQRDLSVPPLVNTCRIFLPLGV